MKHKTLIRQVNILGMIALFLVGCTTPAKPIPASEITTPISASEITTSAGAVIITKVEIPTKDPAGNEAATGYKILLVWFEGANGGVVGDLSEESEDVYITGDDGPEIERYFFGGMDSGKFVLGFTPPTTAQKFTLYWPGNPPIELVLSE